MLLNVRTEVCQGVVCHNGGLMLEQIIHRFQISITLVCYRLFASGFRTLFDTLRGRQVR